MSSPARPTPDSARTLDRFQIHAARVALLIVDFQERLAAAMPEAERIACERHISLLIEMGRRQGWPVVVSQQYPDGLGPTVAPLASALQAPGLSIRNFDKLHFACTDAPPFAGIYQELGRDQWIVTGLESHVCVFQTVRGLLAKGAVVHVPVDAVVSRKPANRDRGLDLMAAMGAVLTTTETVLFDALRVAGTPDFKAMARLIR